MAKTKARLKVPPRFSGRTMLQNKRKAAAGKPAPAPRSTVSTGGQWLNAWEAKNPGMVAPGVSVEQAQTQVPGFDASKMGQPGQDPAWLVAMLQKQGPSGAPGAPADGAAAPAGPQPMSADLQRILSGLQGDADAATAQAGYQRSELQRLYMDPSNPYSQKNLLDKAFRETKLGSLTGMASAGQLYNGAYQNQQASDQQDALQRENAMNEEYRSKVSGVDQGLDEYLRGLRGQGDQAMYGEGDRAAGTYSDVPDESSASQASVDAGGYPDGGSGPGKQAQGQGVSWATWNSWSSQLRDRYRARHGADWDKWRPR